MEVAVVLHIFYQPTYQPLHPPGRSMLPTKRRTGWTPALLLWLGWEGSWDGRDGRCWWVVTMKYSVHVSKPEGREERKTLERSITHNGRDAGVGRLDD